MQERRNDNAYGLVQNDLMDSIDRMSKWFLPFIESHSGENAFLSFNTPFGTFQMKSSRAYEVIVALVVVLCCVYFVHFRRRTKAFDSIEECVEKYLSTTKRKSGNGVSGGTSALQESILKKGANSYYYAHQPFKTTKSKSESGTEAKKVMISSYSWVDMKHRVSIYLTDSIVDTMSDDQLEIQWTKSSFSLHLYTASDRSVAKSLVISSLYNDIKDVSWKRKKNNELEVSLIKLSEGPWKSLNGAVRNLEEHIEYDESIYD